MADLALVRALEERLINAWPAFEIHDRVRFRVARCGPQDRKVQRKLFPAGLAALFRHADGTA
jgi:hypothetical protein